MLSNVASLLIPIILRGIQNTMVGIGLIVLAILIYYQHKDDWNNVVGYLPSLVSIICVITGFVGFILITQGVITCIYPEAFIK